MNERNTCDERATFCNHTEHSAVAVLLNCHHALRLQSPPDPMTQLMMTADGVTEADLDDLIRKVVAARAAW